MGKDAYKILADALREIASYGHHPDCTSCAPVHECGCRQESEQDIAQAALKRVGEEPR